MSDQEKEFVLRWDGDRMTPFYELREKGIWLTLCLDGLREEMDIPIETGHASIVLRTTAKPPRHQNYWNLDNVRRRKVWYDFMPETRSLLSKERRAGRKYAQILY